MTRRFEFARDQVLATIEAGPVQYAALAGTMSDPARAQLRAIIDELTGQGLIRLIQLDRFPHYVTTDWVMPDELRLQLIEGKCRRTVDDCLIWTGYIDPRRGPMVRFGPDGPPTAARRVVWTIKRGPLGLQQTVRAGCDDPACVAYEHMKLGTRADKARGRSLTPLTRLRIARAQQAARGKLDLEKVRAIRASAESETVLAERYGVSKPTIGQIRRNETWREEGGMFTALIPGRARA